MPKYIHHDLKLIVPSFDSSLTDTIIKLEQLRYRKIYSEKVHPGIFFQLKHIFHLLESLESVRIEGNNTTLSEFVDKIIENKKSNEDKYRQIENNRKAIDFIEDLLKSEKDIVINRAFISHLHKIVVNGLKNDGDPNPGKFREKSVLITHSEHKPPIFSTVPSLIDELFNFINQSIEPKYQLLVTAIAHHRFVWIHPFENGNGRVVRLLTYAMLRKHKYSINDIINPTAIFCNDRNEYYDMLSRADTGSEKGILEWSNYVLSNLLIEANKIDKLLNYDYLLENILFPALDYSLERKYITAIEYRILKKAIEQGAIKANDINQIVHAKYPMEISRIVRKMKENRMLIPDLDKKRIYVPCFNNNHLLRGVINSLTLNGFIPFKD